ncbi:MAG: preprotein translocase subunit SecG [Cyclobacteriaceae bacterium]
MYALIIGIIILVAVLLVLVVLAQNPKGGGLSSQFGGSGAGQVMGVKKTTDLLEKLTWGFAIALLVLTLSTNFFLTGDEGSGEFISPNIENAQQQQNALPPSIAPDGSSLEDLGLEGDSLSE